MNKEQTKTPKHKSFDEYCDKKCRMILKTKDKTSSFILAKNIPTAYAQLLEQKIKNFVKRYGGETNWNCAYTR